LAILASLSCFSLASLFASFAAFFASFLALFLSALVGFFSSTFYSSSQSLRSHTFLGFFSLLDVLFSWNSFPGASVGASSVLVSTLQAPILAFRSAISYWRRSMYCSLISSVYLSSLVPDFSMLCLCVLDIFYIFI